MKEPRFTIITVCYNAEKYIKETIESLLIQTCDDYEYIIKDGLSTDNTLKVAKSLLEKKENVKIVSTADNGIYDAMNQAVGMAKGEYIYFLNAGDCFADCDVLRSVSESVDKKRSDIIYGSIIEVDGEKERLRKYTKMNSQIWYFSTGACLCHQSIFGKKSLFEQKKFDLSYIVCADREWQMFHIENDATIEAIKIVVSKILVDGFSKEHIRELEEETKKCIKKYCGIGYIFYSMLVWLKKNRMIKFLLQRIERVISCKEM